ncbi:MAG TPA: DEAD/DEAH box helicase family protein [Limnochordia bacterium]|mgnify:CR=1 FL=1|nr:DEAD/DEAH box helicase family protein [Limnochordia bacterium]
MKLRFDANLDYQADALAAITDLFEGMGSSGRGSEIGFSHGALQLTELGLANDLELEHDLLLQNLRAVQERNNLPQSERLIDYHGPYRFPNFSIEMETGTGKTYVYLRSIFELSKRYGLKKFIIVVPSIAIREGVLSSIKLMREHFLALYDNVPFDYFVYDSKDLSKVRQFAISNEIQIMIINIQAFQRDVGDVQDYAQLTPEEEKRLNIIHRAQDRLSGRRPIEYIQAVRPVVIIDEPQSVDTTPKAKRVINTLSPLVAFRFSATHVEPYHLIYKLDPIQAYDLGLVKQIEVSSIQAEQNYNETFIRIDAIGYTKGAKTPRAKATIHVDTPNGPREKAVTLRQGTDLSDLTNRSGYDGYIVTNIRAEPGLEQVEFANGRTLRLAQQAGGMTDEIMKVQIRQTIEEHLKKEKLFRDRGIKVLSLFFVDKVANYRWYDEEGNPHKGKIAQWFEEIYEELSNHPSYKGLLPYPVEELHGGYFSVDRKKGKVVGLKDTTGRTAADEETYRLIMQDKERLLSPSEPLRFVFSHSALKEGWDNPNVFQVCSLREMGSETERRQTIGRGLRLAVGQDGQRIYDRSINRLTVIASESFEEYAAGLQVEMEREIGGGFRFGRLPDIAFAKLLAPDTDQPIGQEASRRIWQALVEAGYIDENGDLTEKFAPDQKGFQLQLPGEFRFLELSVIEEMKRYTFRNRVVNARERRKLSFNKRIELNEDFKALWERIGRKTRYSVEFSTEELIAKAVARIRQMEPILPPRVFVDKQDLEISLAGVERVKVSDSRTIFIRTHRSLPDILAFLQRETGLTRRTLAEILKLCGRLSEFTANPQAFMTEVAKVIKNALHELVVAGIKYEQIDGEMYEMRLFEEYELETYLSRLYEVQYSKDVTPYDYVPYDSEVELKIAQGLDENENVKFFCKLPPWFVVPTPLGDYNPDWAVVTENDHKLYLVRETKDTKDRGKRREVENRKVDCGRAHFTALGVNFKVATSIHEVLGE